MDTEKSMAFLIHSKGGRREGGFSIETIPFSVMQSLVSDMPKVVLGNSILGKDRSALRDGLTFSFEPGSVKVGLKVAAASLSLLTDSSFASDLRAIVENRLTDVADAARLEAIANIRDVLREEGASTCCVSSGVAQMDEVDIIECDLTPRLQDEIWVDSDAYVRATVTDLGGKTSSNAHLELEDGETIKADTSREYLADLEANMIYKQVVAHVSYPLNVKTREWDRSRVKLLSIELPNESFDRAQFDAAIAGPNGWREIQDPVAEIRRMRSANG